MKKNHILITFTLFLIFSNAFSQSDIGNKFIANISTNTPEIAYNLFSETVKSQLPESQLPAIWKSITDQYGKLNTYHFNCKTMDGAINTSYYTCEFEKEKLDLKLIISQKEKKIEGFFFVPVHSCTNIVTYKVPEYTDTNLFEDTEIKIKSDSILLDATLTVPNNGFKNICIFIHGSGPNDRDETMGPNKIFKDISIGLANNNIASIRFDKRTYSHKNKYEKITIYEEVINDVLAVINYLKEDKLLATKNIYLIGHSLGGMLSPKISSLSKNVDGIIFLAANSRSLDTLLLEQINWVNKLDGAISDIEKKQLEEMEIKINYLNDSLNINSPSNRLPLNLPPTYWLSLKNYDQIKTARKLNVPMLFLQGERDYQVTMEGFLLWKEALMDKDNASFLSYKELNHFFLEGEGKSTPKEYSIQKNVPNYINNDIGKWIKAQD